MVLRATPTRIGTTWPIDTRGAGGAHVPTTDGMLGRWSEMRVRDAGQRRSGGKMRYEKGSARGLRRCVKKAGPSTLMWRHVRTSPTKALECLCTMGGLG